MVGCRLADTSPRPRIDLAAGVFREAGPLKRTDDGRLAVLVLLENPIAPPVKGSASVSNLPRNLEGIPVVEMVVGKIRPLANAAAHQVKQTPPIQLGTSGGWRYDLANGFCCSGTLGSLIHVGTTQYVLSIYYVFWGDI